MIVKIQRCLVPADGPYLVYNKDRSYYAEVPQKVVPKELRDAITDTQLKGYFDIAVDGSTFTVISRVADQSW